MRGTLMVFTEGGIFFYILVRYWKFLQSIVLPRHEAMTPLSPTFISVRVRKPGFISMILSAEEWSSKKAGRGWAGGDLGTVCGALVLEAIHVGSSSGR